MGGFRNASAGGAAGVGFSGQSTKAQRVTTGSVAGAASVAVTLTWTVPFADANYTVSASLVEATASTSTLRIHHIESQTAAAVVVRVVNDEAVTAKTGTIHAIAVRD